MRELVVGLLNLWFTVSDFLDLHWSLMFTVTVSWLWVDGFITVIIQYGWWDFDQFYM